MKKNALILLVAVAISTVSCVDNAVSPQVEAIRAQQVEWMKAKTASELALAEMTKAEITYKAAVTANQAALTLQVNASTANQTALTAGTINTNAHNQSINAILLKERELAYNLAVANNATLLKEAEKNLANANLNLKNALNDLALAVANSGDDLAQEYYTNYSIKAAELSNLYSTRIGIQSGIAGNNLLLSSKTGLLDNLLKLTQVEIDADNIKLIAQKAALETLKSVIADPSSLQTEINTLTKSNITLNASKDKLNTEYVKAIIAINISRKVYTDGQDIIYKMSGYKNELNNVTLNITNQDKIIIDSETYLLNSKLALTSRTLELTNAKVIYGQEKANFDDKLSLYNAAIALKVDKKNDLDVKLNATSIAYSNWDKSTDDANKVKWQDAETLSDAAQTVYTTALNNANNATTALNTASGPYQSAKLVVSNAENAINSAQNTINSAETALLQAKNSNSSYALDKLRLVKAIADLTTSFTTESANQFQYLQNYDAASNVVTEINTKISGITTTVNQNNSVINSLETNKTNIENLKATATAQTATIASTEKSIADNMTLLKTSTEANAKANLEATVAKSTKDLDALNIQITAQEKIVAYWKGLLDKIFTA